MESPDLSAMRAEYARDGLSEADAGDDPIALFDRWLAEAVEADLHEPNAMALATADESGRPSVRIVLLKGLDADGGVFHTNYDSRKGFELRVNARVSAVLLWHPLQRQLRIEGRAGRLDATESDAYFASRPRGSQIGAVASHQSRTIEDREALESQVAETERRFEGRPVERPEHWGGYHITLDVMEFWQGREDRLHDRLRFARTGDTWRRERLQP